MRRVLGVPPLLTSEDLGWSSLRAHLWRHGALDVHVEPMAEHVVMGYFDTPRPIERRSGRSCVRSVTENRSITIIPAGHGADWSIGGPLEVVHLYVPAQRLQRVAESLALPAPELLEAVARPDPDTACLVRLLARELRQGQSHALYADTLSELLCMHLIRGHAANASPDRLRRALSHNPGLAPWQVRRIQDHLLDHIERQVRLKELADLVQLSPKHLCTAFRRSTGIPPHAWISQQRAERAKLLLLRPGAELSQIALALGYPDQSAFGTAFRKATGMSPGRWRRMGSGC